MTSPDSRGSVDVSVVDANAKSWRAELLAVLDDGLLVWMPEQCAPGPVAVHLRGGRGGPVRIVGRIERQQGEEVEIATPSLRHNARVRIRELMQDLEPAATPRPSPMPARRFERRAPEAGIVRAAGETEARPQRRHIAAAAPFVKPERTRTLVGSCAPQAVDAMLAVQVDRRAPMVDLFGFPRRPQGHRLLLRVGVPDGIVHIETEVMSRKGNSTSARMRTRVAHARRWVSEGG